MERTLSLPEITLGKVPVSRLIVGGNPFRGNSRQSPELDREMERYYTVARIKSVLSRCEQEGITAVQARGDAMILAGRRCAGPEAVRETFAKTFARIKPSDAVVVGMYPRTRDQVAENAAFARAILTGYGHGR